MKLIDHIKYYLKRIYFIFFEPKVECNICGWKGFRFNSDQWHPFTICPNCSSQVRQRLLWAGIKMIQEIHIDKLISGRSVLHFAPEKFLRKNIEKISSDYKTADLLADGYNYSKIDYNIDISNLNKIKNDSFNCVIALDVLEHVKDHLKAIEEVKRILKYDGCFIVSVPQKDNLRTTFEETCITDPKERERLYGQSDHLRIYGDDFIELLTCRGFEVFILDEKDFDPNIVKKYVLFPPVLSYNSLATNHRKIFFARKSSKIIPDA
jgi:SAM-dependent methyltransferase